ncbi:MAG: flagellar biosynthetic protein FliO [Magnetococcales bacterium]|nr:flagellar biosynthetic protein FliO [Magnetococcales bacterium]
MRLGPSLARTLTHGVRGGALFSGDRIFKSIFPLWIWLSVLLFSSPLLAAATGGEPSPEPIDLMKEGVEIVGYLLIFIVIAAVVIRVGKHFQPRMGGGGLIRIEDGHNLAPGVGVRLIRVGSRAWLIGVTRERVSLLAEMSEEEIRPSKEGAS